MKSTLLCAGQIYSINFLLQFLNDGHVLNLTMSTYVKNGNQYIKEENGHVVLLCGYAKIGDSYEFIIKDPGPVNQGSIYIKSYDELCNPFAVNPYEEKISVWESTVVAGTDYCDQDFLNEFGN